MTAQTSGEIKFHAFVKETILQSELVRGVAMVTRSGMCEYALGSLRWLSEVNNFSLAQYRDLLVPGGYLLRTGIYLPTNGEGVQQRFMVLSIERGIATSVLSTDSRTRLMVCRVTAGLLLVIYDQSKVLAHDDLVLQMVEKFCHKMRS
eukprot:CFRG1206T1